MHLREISVTNSLTTPLIEWNTEVQDTSKHKKLVQNLAATVEFANLLTSRAKGNVFTQLQGSSAAESAETDPASCSHRRIF